MSISRPGLLMVWYRTARLEVIHIQWGLKSSKFQKYMNMMRGLGPRSEGCQ